jgi:hypothetical protein
MPDADIQEAWTRWLDEPGPRFIRVGAESSAAELIDRFRHSCNRETLIDVCCGAFYTVVAARIVRDHEQRGAEAQFRGQGYATRAEKADDLGRDVACVRVTALKRRPNLHDLLSVAIDPAPCDLVHARGRRAVRPGARRSGRRPCTGAKHLSFVLDDGQGARSGSVAAVG